MTDMKTDLTRSGRLCPNDGGESGVSKRLDSEKGDKPSPLPSRSRERWIKEFEECYDNCIHIQISDKDAHELAKLLKRGASR